MNFILHRKRRTVFIVLVILGALYMCVRDVTWPYPFSFRYQYVDYDTLGNISTQQSRPTPATPPLKYVSKKASMLEKRVFLVENIDANKFQPVVDHLKELFKEYKSSEMPERRNRINNSIILSNWRSGSTFLGDILSSIPGAYYNFEPLMFFSTRKMPPPNLLNSAIDTMRQILQCNFTGIDHYFQIRDYKYAVKHNTFLWNSCQGNVSLCKDPTFVSSVCNKQSYHLTKVVRLMAEHYETFLTDPKLNVKIVLLIRDPRGTMNSRYHVTWCTSPDCQKASNLCKYMVDDFKTAKRLTKEYPNQFKVLRYEDLCTDLFNTTKKVFQFYGLPFDDSVKEFLDVHTQTNRGTVLSTYRDSKTTPFNWIHVMNYTAIQNVQSVCSEAISLWGYKHMDDKSQWNNTDFNPMLEAPFPFDGAIER